MARASRLREVEGTVLPSASRPQAVGRDVDYVALAIGASVNVHATPGPARGRRTSSPWQLGQTSCIDTAHVRHHVHS
jgi:hypothetical protein